MTDPRKERVWDAGGIQSASRAAGDRGQLLEKFGREEAVRLWIRLLVGWRAGLKDSLTHSLLGDGDYQSVTRMCWALGAWFYHPERPGVLKDGSEVVDVGAWILTALRHGTDASHCEHWPMFSQMWDQIVVEAPQVGWAVWCLERGSRGGAADHPFHRLSRRHLENIHTFLRDQDQSVYPHNWGLFVAANHEVRRQLNLARVPGFEASWSREIIDDRLGRAMAMHAGGGWHSDSSISRTTPTFDDYNGWGYLLYLLLWILYTADETDSDLPRIEESRREILQRTKSFLDFQTSLFDSEGGHPEYGRSQSYKFARLSVLTFAYALERLFNTPEKWDLGFSILPASLPAGCIRRLLRLHLNHYLSTGALEPDTGVLRRGITRDSSPELLEGYLTPGSTYWAMTTFAGLWLLPDTDPLWSVPEELLPSETSDYTIWSEPTGFLVSHHRADGHIELFNTRVHKTTGEDLQSKYEKFVYSSRFGHTTRSGSRIDNNISIGSTWRYQPTKGDRWPDDGNGRAVILRSIHSQGENTVQTLIFIRDGLHVRVHRVALGQGTSQIREGGYAVGHTASEQSPVTTAGDDWILHESMQGSAFTARLLGYTTTTEVSGTGHHSRSAGWKIGCHEAPTAPEGSIFASMYRAARFRFDPLETRSAVRKVEVQGSNVTVRWGDGASSVAVFPEEGTPTPMIPGEKGPGKISKD